MSLRPSPLGRARDTHYACDALRANVQHRHTWFVIVRDIRTLQVSDTAAEHARSRRALEVRRVTRIDGYARVHLRTKDDETSCDVGLCVLQFREVKVPLQGMQIALMRGVLTEI